MTDRVPPFGYWSFSGFDCHGGGHVHDLRLMLLAELQQLFDRLSVKRVQGGTDISPAVPTLTDVRSRLGESDFFIAIVTPAYVQSRWCCDEVKGFLERERQLAGAHIGPGQRSRIFPIQLFDIADAAPADPANLAELKSRPWLDLRTMHLPAVRGELSRLARDIAALLEPEATLKPVDPDAPVVETILDRNSKPWLSPTDLPPLVLHDPGASTKADRNPPLVSDPPDPAPASTNKVDFIVVAPPQLRPDERFAVELWASSPADHEAMLAEALRGGLRQRGGRSSVSLKRGTVITAELSLPGFEIAGKVQSLAWEGDIANLAYIVHAPPSLSIGAHAGSVTVKKDCIPFATISFTLTVMTASFPGEAPEPIAYAESRYIRRAFASYANRDRSEVLRRVQGMSAVGVDVFLDVTMLRAGVYWEKRLFREIDMSDRLFLFWSRNAAKSDWVDKEWRYALARHGPDFIDPLPLNDPRSVAPPPELAAKHFGDIYLAFIAAEEARGPAPAG